MRTVNDNPIDPLGSIGSPIRPAAPAKPDLAKPFERGDHTLIGDHSKALESVADTLRRKAGVIAERIAVARQVE